MIQMKFNWTQVKKWLKNKKHSIKNLNFNNKEIKN